VKLNVAESVEAAVLLSVSECVLVRVALTSCDAEARE
jgi:hypothetical protein